ncbi:MAG TPA: Ig-like domain-containing protein, partial [Gemmatimonadales bacterium]|nr:Ig-like domain-containing protein [Gemmatimonadales bacterium]
SVSASQGVLRNDRDPEGGSLTARNASNPPHGKVTLRSDGSFTYNSDPGFYGDDRFTYRVEDAQGKFSTATVTIHVAPVNDSPRFNNRGDVTVDANSGTVSIREWARSITPGADNESDQVLTFDVSNDNPGLFTSGGQPTVTRNGPQSKTGTLSFTPSGQTGTANVTVVLRDNAGGFDTSRPATFRITIR